MTGILYLVWALLCHNPTHIPGKTKCPLQHIIISTMDDGEGGGGDGNGDSGSTPPKPPIPPPPPPPTT